MSRPAGARAVTLTALLLLAATAACSSPVDSEQVTASPLEPATVTLPEGPAYVWEQLGERRPASTAVVGGHSTPIGRVADVTWLPDGNLLTRGATTQRGRRDGEDVGGVSHGLRVLDPSTGEVIRARRGRGDWGVTPEAVTVRSEDRNRITVYDLDLSHPRTLDVPDSAVETDQLEEGWATFQLYHPAYTLDGVTWALWDINSEDDFRTDHGALRLEDGEAIEVLRDQPVVDFLPSSDGAALLMLTQDNGDDETCGGCVVRQRVVELDPATGDVAREYPMPPGYTEAWRVDDVDKIAGTLVVRFEISAASEVRTTGTRFQTWTYDGSWVHLEELDNTRTWWQGGGRLTYEPQEPLRRLGVNPPYQLTWHPDDGPDQVLDIGSDCPRSEGGTQLCPPLTVPGSLLPPDPSS